MNNHDINVGIKRIAETKFGKILSIFAKGIVYLFVAFTILFLIFAILYLTNVTIIYEEKYPLSDSVQKILFEMSDASSKYNIVDFSALFIAFFIWLGLIIGVGIPILYVKYIKSHSEELEYQPRNYLMYLLLIVEAVVYSFGYYKFWGMSVAWGYILIRFIFAILIFFVANVGIKLFVIGYNPLLAIVLNVLSISCLSFAFMFAFYRFIVIPVVIVVIDAIIKEITDSSIIFFWI